MKQKFTADECYTIASFLNSAASMFEDFRKQCETNPAFRPLMKQWERQRDQARVFAGTFANAKDAQVELEWTEV